MPKGVKLERGRGMSMAAVRKKTGERDLMKAQKRTMSEKYLGITGEQKGMVVRVRGKHSAFILMREG